MLHDPRRALGAEHALIDGMVPIAFDVADLTILQVDFDAASAGTHVAGGRLDLVTGGPGQLDGVMLVAQILGLTIMNGSDPT